VQRSAGAPLAVEQWDPFRELIQGVFANQADSGRVHVPRFDIEETEDEWIVETELPGVKRADIDVEVHDGELLVSGEIKERERVGVLRHRTRHVGKFEVRVALPGDVDPQRVDANLDDGILVVHIPKPERTKARKVEVSSHQNGSGGESSGGEQQS
jgi:HSP20 family protein